MAQCRKENAGREIRGLDTKPKVAEAYPELLIIR
jgi:hypothetical protein